MNTWLDRELIKVKVQEMLEEAAKARANRKARKAYPSPVARKLRFALAALAAVPFVLWILWVWVAGWTNFNCYVTGCRFSQPDLCKGR